MVNNKLAPAILASSLAVVTPAQASIDEATTDISRKVDSSLTVSPSSDGIIVTNDGTNSKVSVSIESIGNNPVIGVNGGFYDGEKGVFIDVKKGDEIASVFATGTYNGENVSSQATIGRMQKDLEGKDISQVFVGAQASVQVTDNFSAGAYANKTKTEDADVKTWETSKKVNGGTEVTTYNQVFNGYGKEAVGVNMAYTPTERDKIMASLGYSKTDRTSAEYSAEYSHLTSDLKTKFGASLSGNTSGDNSFELNTSRKVGRNSEIGAFAGVREFNNEKDAFGGVRYTYNFDGSNQKYSTYSTTKTTFDPYSHVNGANEASRNLYGKLETNKSVNFIPDPANIDIESPKFLNGVKAETFTINLGDNYTPRLLTGIDNIDGNLTAEVKNNVNVNIAGTYTVVHTLKDTAGNISTITDTVIVKALNNAPEINNKNSDYQVLSGQKFELKINATDKDGDKLQFEAIGLPQGLTLNGDTISGNTTELTSKEGKKVTLKVSDGKGGITEGVIFIKVFKNSLERVDFEIIETKNPNLLSGERRVTQAGIPGIKNVNRDKDGNIVTETIVTEATPEKVDIGTLVLTSNEETVRENEVVFKTVTNEDNTILKGEEKVVQEGVNGYDLVVYKIEKDQNGRIISKTETSRNTVAPVDKIIQKGTLEITSNEETVRENEVGFKTVTNEDNTILKGEEKVVQEGVNGYDLVVYKIEKDQNGRIISKTETSRNTVAPVDKIVKVGTLEITSNEETVRENEVVFKTVTNEDNTIPKGQEIVIQEGVNGYDLVVYKIEKDQNGRIISKTETSRNTVAPVDKIVKVGTLDTALLKMPERIATIDLSINYSQQLIKDTEIIIEDSKNIINPKLKVTKVEGRNTSGRDIVALPRIYPKYEKEIYAKEENGKVVIVSSRVASEGSIVEYTVYFTVYGESKDNPGEIKEASSSIRYLDVCKCG